MLSPEEPKHCITLKTSQATVMIFIPANEKHKDLLENLDNMIQWTFDGAIQIVVSKDLLEHFSVELMQS